MEALSEYASEVRCQGRFSRVNEACRMRPIHARSRESVSKGARGVQARVPGGLHVGRRDGLLPDRGRGPRGRARREHLGPLRPHAGPRPQRRHRRRGLRSLPPVPRRRRPHGRAGPRRLPLLDRLAAGPARRDRRGQRGGLDFYDRLVDALLERGIAPHATLYHWDLPRPSRTPAGGRPGRPPRRSPPTPDVVARRLGDRVATLATLNEPWCSSDLGYANGIHAPGRTDRPAALAAAHHLLVAHGMAMAAIRAAAPAPAGRDRPELRAAPPGERASARRRGGGLRPR